MLRKLLIDARLFSPKPTGISVYIEEAHLRNIGKYLEYYDRIVILHNRECEEDFSMIKQDSRLEYRFTGLSPFNPLHVLLLSVQLNKFSGTAIWPIYSSTFFKGNRKDIVMVHDLMYQNVPYFLSKSILVNGFKRLVLNSVVGCALRNSDMILANSIDTGNAVYRWIGRMPSVCPLGIRSIRSGAKSFFEHQDYFLYVGGSRPHKNLDWMVEIFLKTKNNRKLVLAGVGHDRFKFLSERVIVVDSPDDDLLSVLYNNARYVVVPSLYEGFGLPILEGLSYGKSILASRRGALLEFESFGVNYFDPVCPDELKAYFNNELLISQKSDFDLSKFSWLSYRKMFKTIIR